MPKYIQIKDRRHQRGCSHQTPSTLSVHCPPVPLISIALLPRFPFHRGSFYNLPFSFSPLLSRSLALAQILTMWVVHCGDFFLAYIPALNTDTLQSLELYLSNNISETVRSITLSFLVTFPCFLDSSFPLLCFPTLFGQCALVLLIDASIVSTENEWDFKLLLQGIASKIVTT